MKTGNSNKKSSSVGKILKSKFGAWLWRSKVAEARDEDPRREKVHRVFRLTAHSMAAGALAGLVVTLYRRLIPLIGAQVKNLLLWGRQSFGGCLVFLGLMALFALLSAFFVQREPMIGGSGIPQVAGKLKGQLHYSWLRVLVYKFLGGLLSLGGGLTLGREGPSVQIGAAVGEAYAEKTKMKKSDSDLLMVSGSAAGLSAAFNAPLAGVIFAQEELHKVFTPRTMLSAFAAALTADFISALVFSSRPVLSLPLMQRPGFRLYGLLCILGVVIGLSGALFNTLIMAGKRVYAKLRLPLVGKILLPFLLTGVAVLLDPRLFSAGEAFIFIKPSDWLPASEFVLLYVEKLLLLVLAFCSGIPGGIFFPLLVLGSLVGNAFGTVLWSFGLLSAEEVTLFSILAMGAHFGAIVRSPITGILLIVEMTASLRSLLPLGVVTLFAYVTVEFCRSAPIYDSLLDFILKGKRQAEKQSGEHRDRQASQAEQHSL